jgi:hypothetical protein
LDQVELKALLVQQELEARLDHKDRLVLLALLGLVDLPDRLVL